MKVCYDEEIRFLGATLAKKAKLFGIKCEAFSAATLTPALLRECDILVVRSVTRVDQALLAQTNVQVVITGTAGTDHLDKAYLEQAGIKLYCCYGSNANAVKEYVLTVFLSYLVATGKHFSHTTVGLIGCGNVGRLVLATLRAFGVKVLVYDPPLLRELRALKNTRGEKWRGGEPFPLHWFAGNKNFMRHNVFAPHVRVQAEDLCHSLAEIAAKAHFITMHVPLVGAGADKTYGMLGEEFFAGCRQQPWVVNTARGGVIVEEALLRALAGGDVGGAVVDVWANEPRVNKVLLRKARFGTPHCAGYSVAASMNIVYVVMRIIGALRDEACGAGGIQGQFLARSNHSFSAELSREELRRMEEVCQRLTGIAKVSAQLKAGGDAGASAQPAHQRLFQSLRKERRERQEWNSYAAADLAALARWGQLRAVLKILGFSAASLFF